MWKSVHFLCFLTVAMINYEKTPKQQQSKPQKPHGTFTNYVNILGRWVGVKNFETMPNFLIFDLLRVLITPSGDSET